MITVGKRAIGDGAPCLIIAEVGTAHAGDLSRAYGLVDAAAEAGADCVKFQTVIADEILHPLTGEVMLPGGKTSLYQRFRALERDLGFYTRLKDYTEQRGCLFLSSVFGVASAQMLKTLDVAVLKIASPELNHVPLLKEVAGYGIPVILSTGVSTLEDIDKAVAIVHRAILLHCITAYPAPEDEYNLRVINELVRRFHRPVGVSDHSLDPVLVPAAGVACGACAVEKHFTLNRRGGGLDDPIALNPSDFAVMTAAIRRVERQTFTETMDWLRRDYGGDRVEAVLGDGKKQLAPSERNHYATTNRSIHAREDLVVGERLTLEKLCIVRSEKNLIPGLFPEHLPRLLGQRLRRKVSAGQGITWEDLEQTGASP